MEVRSKIAEVCQTNHEKSALAHFTAQIEHSMKLCFLDEVRCRIIYCFAYVESVTARATQLRSVVTALSRWEQETPIKCTPRCLNSFREDDMWYKHLKSFLERVVAGYCIESDKYEYVPSNNGFNKAYRPGF